jgi:transposase
MELNNWSRSLGSVQAFGIEGTGSYGAGLSRNLMSQGLNVIEVTRPSRQLRYQHGKNDSLDAEGAARSVLSGQAIATPKTQLGSVEIIRHLKIARDTTIKSLSVAMVALKKLIINAPTELRDGIDQIKGKVALIRHIASLRPRPIISTTASVKAAMRSLADRWLMLNDEVTGHDKELKSLVEAKAPSLMASHGIATMTIAEMLILVGDNPSRIRSEAALAKLCGVCPIPAFSGKTHRFRLNRAGSRQANAALYRVAIVRMVTNLPSHMFENAPRTAKAKVKSSAA